LGDKIEVSRRWQVGFLKTSHKIQRGRQHSNAITANRPYAANSLLLREIFCCHNPLSASCGRVGRKGKNRPLTKEGAPMANLQIQLNDYRLTTAEILYHLPDHPGLLQSFIWQNYDIAPKYPELKRFLDFWIREIDGKLHSVIMASRLIISAAEIGHAGVEFSIH
jgi:uncharacterized protein Usg